MVLSASLPGFGRHNDELKRSEIRREFVFGDTSVALAGMVAVRNNCLHLEVRVSTSQTLLG